MPHDEPSDRHELVVLQVLRTYGATESLDSCSLLLRDGARFCCQESPAARSVAAYHK